MAATITLAEPSMGPAPPGLERGCAAGAAICAADQPGQHLRVVLRAGQHVPVAECRGKGTAPDWSAPVDVGRHVVAGR